MVRLSRARDYEAKPWPDPRLQVGNDPVGNDPVGNEPVGNAPVGTTPIRKPGGEKSPSGNPSSSMTALFTERLSDDEIEHAANRIRWPAARCDR